MRPDDLYARLSRIVDRDESPEDWNALEAAAHEHPDVWHELVALLRDECEVRHALAPSLARASFVDPVTPRAEVSRAEGARAETREVEIRPLPVVHVSAAASQELEAVTPGRTWAWFSLGFAAALLCAFLLSFRLGSGTTSAPQPTIEGLTKAANSEPSDVLLARYLERGQRSGRIVQELPSVTLDIKSTDSEELHVVFVRRIVEQKRIKGAWRLAQDEHGAAVPVLADPRELEVGRRF